MSASKSDSRSESQQRSITQGLEGELGTSDGVILANVKGKPTITIDRSGVDSQGIQALAERFSEGARQVIDSASRTQRETTAALSSIAQVGAGTQSEAGRLVGQLALPVLVFLAIVLFFRRKR